MSFLMPAICRIKSGLRPCWTSCAHALGKNSIGCIECISRLVPVYTKYGLGSDFRCSPITPIGQMSYPLRQVNLHLLSHCGTDLGSIFSLVTATKFSRMTVQANNCLNRNLVDLSREDYVYASGSKFIVTSTHKIIATRTLVGPAGAVRHDIVQSKNISVISVGLCGG